MLTLYSSNQKGLQKLGALAEENQRYANFMKSKSQELGGPAERDLEALLITPIQRFLSTLS